MDPNILSIILGVVANGFTSLITYLGHQTGKSLIGKEFLEKWELEKTALQPILHKAIIGVEEEIPWQGPPPLEVTCLFLLSPEVEAFVRQIFSAKLSGDKKQNSLETIRKEFLASFSLYTDIEKEQLTGLARILFDSLLNGCGLALDRAIDMGILSAHEAKDIFRHQIILDELATIKKNLTLLTGRQKPNVQEILAFEEKYRQQVANRHGYITPPYFDAARKLPIHNLYVYPNFISPTKRRINKQEELSMKDFLSGIYRAVLLGNPGGGKSTLTLKLCYDIATRYSERFLGGRQQITPILVVLRDYGAEKKIRNCSILQFIEAKANANYQLEPPPNAFKYMLLNSRAIVIFDGLDELLDTSYRLEISSDVESFCNLYPSVPVLVTSREVGYEQAPLDEKRFEIFRLAPFQKDQVKNYVTKWFSVDTDLTPNQREQQIKTFFEESQSVEDLRSNPLMLALMCNIYRGENYIPKNRPEVYEKCATMLFERWDKGRGIHYTLPFEAHISPAMKYLAYWIYSDEGLRGGVTERKLVAKATEYLTQRRFEDRDEAESAAYKFIEFCRGRAWVFTDTGTTKEGERLYQFTHQTFLEYFTAAHLIRMHPTPSSLLTILQPKIAKEEWDVVAQLAFQLQNKNVEDAGDELLNSLVEQARKIDDDETGNLLSFAARCLEFMVPSPKITRKITKDCFERSLVEGHKRVNQEEPYHEPLNASSPQRLFSNLLSAASENRIVIVDTLAKQFIERITFGSDLEAALALVFGLHLQYKEFILDNCSDRINKLCSKYFWVCFQPFYEGKISITDIINWHGIKSIFNIFPTITEEGGIWIDIANVLISNFNSGDISHEKNIDLKALKEVGPTLLSYPLPWIKEQQVRPTGFIWTAEINNSQSINQNEFSDLDSNVFFSIFILYAVILEWSRPTEYPTKGKRASSEEEMLGKGDLIKTIKESSLPALNYFRWTLLARFEKIATDKIQVEMDSCKFTADQQNFVWMWIRQEIDLVLKETTSEALPQSENVKQ